VQAEGYEYFEWRVLSGAKPVIVYSLKMPKDAATGFILLAAAIFHLAFGQQTKPAFVREFKWPSPPGSTFPEGEWQKVKSPEAAGYSSAKLDALRVWLKTQNTTGMLVVVSGRVVFEYGDAAQVSKVASVRKSVLGMLLGNYVASGQINLQKTVKEIKLDDLDQFLPIEERATLQNLIMSRSGIYLEADSNAPRKGSQAPGSLFYYNNWDFNAAGTAFEKLTGRNIFDALEADLARPIGMQDYDRGKQKTIQTVPENLISVHPEYAMYLSTRDMARLGLLMLRQGKWKDADVLPKNWVDYLTTVHTPAAEMWPAGLRRALSAGPSLWGYGALWWVWDAPRGTTSANWTDFTGSYTAMGTDGQYITVIPLYDVVVAHKNANIDQTPDRDVSALQYQTILQMILDAHCGGGCR
jgi:CubicO group peptidase (beta-lactamase class C family)